MSSVDMAQEAGGFVRKMIARESMGWGDQSEAQRRLETRYGLPFWSLEHLRTGKAKSCETSLYMRIKSAFIDHCGKQAAALLREAETARKATGNVSERPEGFVIAETGEVVGYQDKRIRHSPDGEFHWCAHQSGVDAGRTICLFVPPRSF